MTRAPALLFWFSLIIAVSLGLYHISYRVDQTTRQLRSLNAQIEAEQRNLHVLKAEWVYLANPARIEAIAHKHLDLKPTAPVQIARMDKLARVLPARHEAAAGTAVAAARPIANLRTAAATHTPRVAAEESGRLNTRLVINKTAATDKPVSRSAYRLAGDDSYGIANVGSVP